MTKRLYTYGTLALLIAVSLMVGWAIRTPVKSESGPRQWAEACECADAAPKAASKP